jgi:hypothetical protein
MTLRQALLIDLIFIAICILLFCRYCIGADLALSGNIVIPNKVRLTWGAPAGEVDGYKVYALSSAGRSVFVTDSMAAVLDLSNVPLTGIERVKFCVTAYNDAGESAPSDTVSLPMASARFLFGDLNHDGAVDVLDSALLWARGMVGSRVGMPAYSAEFDIDADGIISTKDHLAFVINMGNRL